MRDYSKISPKFWIGRTGKEIRKLGPSAQIVALYLLTGPHANLLGLYHLPVLYIAADTGMDGGAVTSALKSLTEADFCQYDFDAEMAWVTEMARYQCLDAGCDGLKPTDNRVKAIRKEYAALPETPLLASFFRKYTASLCLNAPRGFPAEAPCIAPPLPLAGTLPSQEKEQEQKPEQEPLSPDTPVQTIETAPSPQPPECERESREREIRALHTGENDDMDVEFLELAEEYPRKDPPRLAWPSWKNLKHRRRLPTGGLNAVIDAVHTWRETDEWQRDDGRFIPSLKKFLEGEYWTVKPRAAPAALPHLAEARAFVSKYGQNEGKACIEALTAFCQSKNLEYAAYAAHVLQGDMPC